MTYEEILDRCLGKVSDDLDKREGSFIYTALAPLCYELANIYFEVENMLELSFVGTAYEQYLDDIGEAFGVYRNEATKNTKRAEIICSSDLVGEKFSVGTYVFVVTEVLSDDVYLIEADDYGEEYNYVTGSLSSIMNIQNIESAEILENVALASDVESDENLRIKIIERINVKSFGGNISDYKEKAMEVSGVYGACVFTASDMEASNVHLVVSTKENAPASEELISQVYELFNGSDDELGVAPIGHNVSVSTCEYLDIDISVEIAVSNSFDLVVQEIKQNIESYINGIEFEDSVVSSFKIMSTVFQDDRVIDIANLVINNGESSLKLLKTSEKFQVARVNNINVTQMT